MVGIAAAFNLYSRRKILQEDIARQPQPHLRPHHLIREAAIHRSHKMIVILEAMVVTRLVVLFAEATNGMAFL